MMLVFLFISYVFSFFFIQLLCHLCDKKEKIIEYLIHLKKGTYK